MVKSVGLDLVEIARIKASVDRYGERFVRRILGGRELAMYEKRHDRVMFIAGRFAAKEAVIKALGCYLSDRPALADIQITNSPTGQPMLVLPDEVQARLPNARCIISITHEKRYACAVAIFVEEK